MAPKKSVRNKHKAKLVTGEKFPCAFCRQTIDEEVSFGKLYEIGDIQCHYFCVLLSSCLVQKGKDDDGLYGFLYEDILAEVERSKKHKCSFCGAEGATLGCSISQCKKQFHLPCGRERQAVSLFYGNYKSFCHAHAPKQSIPPAIMAKAKLRTAGSKRRSLREKIEGSGVSISNDSEAECVCVICYELVSGTPGPGAFWPPCCAKDAWFHRPCLERMALSAGVHYLKCPLCNDKDIFREAVIRQGYYVPDRDAAWELEQNAFSDMYERAVACVAESCLCDMGRGHDADTGPWDIRPCLLCGSSGIHAHCWASQDRETRQHFVCRTCQPAAPVDLDALATSIEALTAAEQRRVPRSRSGPVMPSRMSLRRTKGNLSSMPGSSRQLVVAKKEILSEAANTNTVLSREELNLKPPTRPPLHNNNSNIPVVPRYSPKSSPLSKDTKSPFNDSKSVVLQSPTKEGNSINPIRLSFDLKSEPQSPINVAKSIKLATSPFNSLNSPQKEINSPLKEGKSPFKNSNIDIPSNLSPKTARSPLKENCQHKANSPFKEGNSIIYSPSPKKRILESLSPVKDCTNSQYLKEDINELDMKNSKHMFKKKNIMSDILNNLFDGLLKEDSCGQMCSKQKQPIREWCSPRKETEAEDVEAQQSPSVVGEVTGKAPFSPTSVALLDSSIEISEHDTGRVDVTIEDQRGAKADKNRCALKFSPSNKEILRDENVNIDLEIFKSRYLNEVSRETHAANSGNKSLRGKRKREERIVLEYGPKTRGRVRNDIKVRIKWRKERLKLKITEGRRERRVAGRKGRQEVKNLAEGRKTRRQDRNMVCGKGRKRKLSETEAKDKSYTQYVLQYSPEVTSKIVKPEHEVPVKKRAYTKQGKSQDKLVQTCLDSFFKVKPN